MGIIHLAPETSHAIDNIRRMFDTTALRAVDKIVCLTSWVVSEEKQGHMPCLYGAAGKPQPFTLADIFADHAHDPAARKYEDDLSALSFDSPQFAQIEKLRDSLAAAGVIGKEATHEQALAAASNASLKILLTMHENKTDIARLDHRGRLVPVILHKQEELHTLNRVGLPMKP